MSKGKGKREKGNAQPAGRLHVVLVGLPGSGKTTVGRLVAQALGATFSDIDELIEREEGKGVAEIFAERGEAAFREMEQGRVESLLATPASVIAPGGGWAAQPGSMELVGKRGLAVYLATEPGEASRRVVSQGHRPLLAGGNPLERMRSLFEARRGFYDRAKGVVRTDGRTPEMIARDVVALARALGGW